MEKLLEDNTAKQDKEKLTISITTASFLIDDISTRTKFLCDEWTYWKWTEDDLQWYLTRYRWDLTEVWRQQEKQKIYKYTILCWSIALLLYTTVHLWP